MSPIKSNTKQPEHLVENGRENPKIFKKNIGIGF